MTRDEIISQSKAEGGMMMVIPSVVLLDLELPLSARVLYGIITWRCNQDAYTRATNKKLGDDLGISAKRVSSLLSLLEEHGHIQTVIKYKDNSKEILCRYIFPIMKSTREMVMAEICADPLPQNEDTPTFKQVDLPENGGGPLPQNEEVICNNKIKHTEEHTDIPPKAPQGVRRARRKKSVPVREPERFEKFWHAYPRDEDRARAVEEWDKLLQDKELLAAHGGESSALLDEIALGLGRHLACEEWRRNVGIPHAFRWLRDRKWTEKQKIPLSQVNSSGPLPEPEVRNGWR